MFAAIDPGLVLWTYIVLLVVGGLVGFLRAGSRASLIASSVFAAALAVCAVGLVKERLVPTILMVMLLVVFAIRLAKTRKFMPSGLMLVVTVVALGLLHARF